MADRAGCPPLARLAERVRALESDPGRRLEGMAFRPELMAKLGQSAREYVRQNFLITLNLGDYLVLMNYLGKF